MIGPGNQRQLRFTKGNITLRIAVGGLIRTSSCQPTWHPKTNSRLRVAPAKLSL